MSLSVRVAGFVPPARYGYGFCFSAGRQTGKQADSQLDTDRQPDAQTDRCGSHPIRDTQSQAMPRPCVHVNRAAAQLRTAAVLFRFLLACRMEADVILHAELMSARFLNSP